MANDRKADDCRRSKFVTTFLLDTCGLLQPASHQVAAALTCAAMAAERPPADDETVLIPLTTGSAAEFYIQPMLSCVGDVDIMFHRSTELAIPYGQSPPSQLSAEFHSSVTVYEIIDSEYPGYVYLVFSYLLTENTDTDKFDCLIRFSRRHSVTYDRKLCANERINGPAVTVHILQHKLPQDRVGCVRCLSWPKQAADWPTRDRNYNWPDSATVDRVVSNGCDVVKVAHPQCRQDPFMNANQWRLSFSRAEIALLNSWMSVQQIVYHVIRVFVKTEQLTDITDSAGRKMLSNYHIKTLMLWACELKPRSWWIDDLNVVRICDQLLHIFADWLENQKCPHYFLNNCSLIDTTSHVEIVVSKLVPITDSWLSTWFVNNYLLKCAQLCPDELMAPLFRAANTSTELQNAFSAVVHWRQNSVLSNLYHVCEYAELQILNSFDSSPLTATSCCYWTRELAKIDSSLSVYFTATAFLHVSQSTTRHGSSDEAIDVIATLLELFAIKRRYSNQLGSVLSLRQSAKLMKVVVNNSRSTVQLTEIELCKAYLYRALRCKDSDSDSIYCLTNVYLAVLYYTTGQYQTAIDHCTPVTRSQDHSQCSSHVVQGELLPKIDNNIDSVLGLAVFYQYVRTAALNQQTQHVGVFTTELFAHYLHIRCQSVLKCRQLTQLISADDDGQRYIKFMCESKRPFTVDVLLLKSMSPNQTFRYTRLPEQCRKPTATATELDTSELVELLQQSAVEHLATYRQLHAQKFASVATIVTTDFESLYAYKRGDYQQCLQLSTQNVRTLLYEETTRTNSVLTSRAFIQLLDEDIVSLAALIELTFIDYPRCVKHICCYAISQITLSLYLMTQCQLKLRHPVESVAQTLDYVEFTRGRCPDEYTLECLTLKLTERKLMSYLSSIT